MARPGDDRSDGQLRFLAQLVEQSASVAGDVLQLSASLWAIHGYFPVDGDVLMAEFDTYDEATDVLGRLALRSLRLEDR